MFLYSQMYPSNIRRFATTAIEAVSATVVLPNAKHIQITVVYRSPCTPETTFVTVLSHYLLRHLSLSNTACMILGYFNEDLLQQESSTLLRFMSDYGFTQLVKSPTTAQGTMFIIRIPLAMLKLRCKIHTIVTMIQFIVPSQNDI